jgi:hypothetical protein
MNEQHVQRRLAAILTADESDSRDDTRIPIESGREIAASIPNARFVPLESRNHLFLQQEKAWARFLSEVTEFLHSESTAEL